VQVSDIENNTVFVDKSVVEVDDLLQELRHQFNSERITWDCTDGLKVFTDYILLRTILTNLLSNALKYSKNNSQILFYGHSVSAESALKVHLSVTNDIGAAGAPDPGLVFNRYYRGVSTSGLPGTGLGLWLSQSIAETIQSQIVMDMFEGRISFSIDVDADAAV
jgi:signal transduction histidine kinase